MTNTVQILNVFLSILKTQQNLKSSHISFTRLLMLICGNKMPTRCNRGFYCRSYCLLNMFRAPLCPSSGAQEYYTVVAAVVFRTVVFKLLVWCGAEGYVSGLQDAAAPDQQLENHSTKYHSSNHCIILLSS